MEVAAGLVGLAGITVGGRTVGVAAGVAASGIAGIALAGEVAVAVGAGAGPLQAASTVPIHTRPISFSQGHFIS